ncbi:MAG: hypothetical protein NWE98_02090 [Candidatus Bathyarchaeota archaeon]|nr:hypothetical protein [Candidatus Bathyarchaeota archaeon]
MTTGKNWVLGTYSGSTGQNLGGKPFNVKIERHMLSTADEAGTAQRRLVNQAASGIYYIITFKLKLQNLYFITTYCMPSEEGDLPSFNLYTDDGIEKRGFTNCLVDTCQISVEQGGKAVVASVKVLAISSESANISITPATAAPITKAGILTTLNNIQLTKWVNIDFGVNNNVQVVESGNGVECTEIFAQQAVYSGRLRWIKTGALAYGFSTTTKHILTITVIDNESTSKTLTFSNAIGSPNSKDVEELGLTFEEVNWIADTMVIS